ncbi:AAA family ATPase [Pontibacter locisalis]|uniref:AAA family ATPase n=1 Tax=Pontibacter locisalis TaxID=1719035 RepID=A0ABW5IMG6_9BACT
MAQVTGIGFSNFRVFCKANFFDFAPISVFTGTNSSGKSSIFKGLSLASDNVNNPNKLVFSGNSHKLGTFSNALNFNSQSKELDFKLKVSQGRDVNLVDDFIFVGKYVNDKKYSEDAALRESLILTDNIDDSVVLCKTSESNGFINLFVNLKFFLDQVKIKKIPFAQGVYDEICSGVASIPVGFNVTLLNFLDYDFSVIDKQKFKEATEHLSIESISSIKNKLEERILEEYSNITFNGFETNRAEFLTVETYYGYLQKYHDALDVNYYFFIRNVLDLSALELLNEESSSAFSVLPNDLKVKDVISNDFLLMCQDIIAPQVAAINENLKQAFAEVKLIEAVRANSQRLYTNQSQGTAFNKLLLNIGQSWDTFQQTDEYGFSAKKFVEKWLVKFNIGDSLSIKRVKGIATEVIIEKDGRNIDLIDLGYGVTQFLPILLYIAFKLKSKGYTNHMELIGFKMDSANTKIPLLLIEEPESNLHPKLQSLLADFFVDVTQTFEVTLLIETHSEYLIRRLQVLTAAGEAKPEDSVIYYLDGNIPSDFDKFVRKININPDGSLTNDFGPGFIDEATNWKLELMRLRNAHLYNVN